MKDNIITKATGGGNQYLTPKNRLVYNGLVGWSISSSPADVTYNGQEQKYVPNATDTHGSPLGDEKHICHKYIDMAITYNTSDFVNVHPIRGKYQLVPKYPNTVSFDDYDNPNDDGTPSQYPDSFEFSYRITPRLATIHVNDASKVYGEPDPTFTYTIEGLLDGDTIDDIALIRANSGIEDPGTYKDVLTVSYTGNPNYSITVERGDFTIYDQKKNPPGTIIDSNTTILATLSVVGMSKNIDIYPKGQYALKIDGTEYYAIFDNSTISFAAMSQYSRSFDIDLFGVSAFNETDGELYPIDVLLKLNKVLIITFNYESTIYTFTCTLSYPMNPTAVISPNIITQEMTEQPITITIKNKL